MNLNLKPSDIRYSQDSICKYFIDKTTLIGKTLDDICEGRCMISDIPRISVKWINDNWVTADNRRLWVFKHVERLGKCTKIPVLKATVIPHRKMTSRNHGASIIIRGREGGGNPGGIWHLKEPTPQPPNPSTSNIESDKTHIDLNEERQSVANLSGQNKGQSTNLRYVGLTSVRTSLQSPPFLTRLSQTNGMNLNIKSSGYHRYGTQTNEADQVQLVRPVTVKQTVTTLKQHLDQRDKDETNGLNTSHTQQVVSRVLEKTRNKAMVPMSGNVTSSTVLRQKSKESNHFGMQSMNVRNIQQQAELERGLLAEKHSEASSNFHVKSSSENSEIREIGLFEYDYSGNKSKNVLPCAHRIPTNDTIVRVNLINKQTETNDGHKLNLKGASKKIPRHSTAIQTSTTKSVASRENTKLVDTPLRDLSLEFKQRNDEWQYDLNEKPQPVGNMFEYAVRQRTQVKKRRSMEFPESTSISQKSKEIARHGILKDNVISQQTHDGHTLQPRAIQRKAPPHSTAIQKCMLPDKVRILGQEAENERGLLVQESSETSPNFHSKDSSINPVNRNIGSSGYEFRDIQLSNVLPGPQMIPKIYKTERLILSSQQTITNDREKLKRKSIQTKALLHTTAIQTSTSDSMDTEKSTKRAENPLRDLSLRDIHMDVDRNDRERQQVVKTLGNRRPSEQDGPAAKRQRKETKLHLTLKPSEIRYSRATICNNFKDKSRLIGDTLDEICEGRCTISRIPTISVKQMNGRWVTADNRRLWVFKQVERLGKCTKILVQETEYIDPRKLNSLNGGTSIKIRGGGNPGGSWYLKPTPQPPPPSTSNIYVGQTQYGLQEERQPVANIFGKNVEQPTNFRSLGLTSARTSTLTPPFRTRLSQQFDRNLDETEQEERQSQGEATGLNIGHAKEVAAFAFKKPPTQVMGFESSGYGYSRNQTSNDFLGPQRIPENGKTSKVNLIRQQTETYEGPKLNLNGIPKPAFFDKQYRFR